MSAAAIFLFCALVLISIICINIVIHWCTDFLLSAKLVSFLIIVMLF